jgi:DNA-binding GntR family transcriptional regulator
MRRLESEGLIVRTPGHGFVVRKYTEEDARENYYLRGLLESEAARLAAQRIQPDEIEALRAINRALAEAAGNCGDDPREGAAAAGAGGLYPGANAWALVDLNARFHQKIHECSGMPGLASLISRLWVGLTVLTPLLTPGRPLQSVAEHERLIEALAARDPGAAAAAMREHIGAGARAYFSVGRGGMAEVNM